MLGDIEFRIDQYGVALETGPFDAYLTWDGVFLAVGVYVLFRLYRMWAGK